MKNNCYGLRSLSFEELGPGADSGELSHSILPQCHRPLLLGTEDNGLSLFACDRDRTQASPQQKWVSVQITSVPESRAPKYSGGSRTN